MRDTLRFSGEGEFKEWFYDNYDYFHFREIYKYDSSKGPDCVVIDDGGSKVCVELELIADRFRQHTPSFRGKVDLIVAAYSRHDKLLGVPIVCIHKVDTYAGIDGIKINKAFTLDPEVVQWIEEKKEKTRMSMSYVVNDILWRIMVCEKDKEK